ncbi:hypothetical protein J4433_01115 [Candidatus Pacearchaeota archaeon]|nr:hypothetical protein [Candidatus Pacearchaeota archaeon]
MEQYTQAKLFERRQEDLDAAIKGNILAMIDYTSAKKLSDNSFEINNSISM